MKVAIITSGYLPVPASKGGAVENIVENFIIENEIEKKVNFEIFSIYDENAENIGYILIVRFILSMFFSIFFSSYF